MPTSEPEPSRVPASVTWGLLFAWVVHDIEELATMSSWSREAAATLAERYPSVPEAVWRRVPMGQTQASVAIALVGVVMAAASADGARTGGRSPFFQAMLAGFGWHALTHVGQTVAYGGYTPGVATAPTVVAPYSLWAWRRLKRAGVVRRTSGGSWALWAMPAMVGGAHVVGRLVERRMRRRRSR